MDGLSAKEVEERIRRGLVNTDVQVKTKTVGQIIRGNTFTLFNFVNGFLAICMILVHSYKNMMFIFVALWNILIGVVQEIRAKRVIDRLSFLSHSNVKVIRDGKKEEISQQEIVLDDLILLQNGNQIPTDSVICEGECQVNEGLLTGESEPVLKKEGDQILSGSFLVAGHVTAKVIHVGEDNYVNQITGQAKYLKKPNSQMMKAIKIIIKIVSICLIPMGIVLFYRQINYAGQNMNSAVVSTVAAMIGMIPSGLVLLTSIVLAVSVIRLAKYNTLVQEMFCIETLARVDVLCLDKTGTITEGRMQVEDIRYFSDQITEEGFSALMKNFCVAVADSNPTFLAVNDRFDKVNCEEYKAEKTIPFSSEKKYSSVVFAEHGTVIMGAPEFVLKDGCSKSVQEKIDYFCSQGKRVMAVCLDGILLAMIVISDVIRKEAPETLSYFHSQGVQLKIISGDNPITVSKVAEQAGLKEADKWINAVQLKTDEELYAAAEKYTVFGRVTPEQKLKLIKALKDQGHVVGMTGDGANDVMALKEADCSIAMQSGSDAARNASQLVLLDSNFSSMPKIVAEGRRSINNVERSAVLYLSKTIYSFLLTLLFIFLPMAYPFQPIQFTLIGAFSIGIPSFVLALEPNKDRVQGSFLGNVMQKAIPGGILVVVNVILGMLISVIGSLSAGQTSTLATILTTVAAMVILLDVCRPWNRIRALLFALMTAGFVFAFNIMEKLFGISTLKVEIYILICACGACTYLIHTGISLLIFCVFHRKMSND